MKADARAFGPAPARAVCGGCTRPLLLALTFALSGFGAPFAQSVDDLVLALVQGDSDRAMAAFNEALTPPIEGRKLHGFLTTSFEAARSKGQGARWIECVKGLRSADPNAEVLLKHLLGYAAAEQKLLATAWSALSLIPLPARGPSIQRTLGDLASRQDDSERALQALVGRTDEVAAAQRRHHQALVRAREEATVGQGISFAAALVLCAAVFFWAKRL